MSMSCAVSDLFCLSEMMRLIGIHHTMNELWFEITYFSSFFIIRIHTNGTRLYAYLKMKKKIEINRYLKMFDLSNNFGVKFIQRVMNSVWVNHNADGNRIFVVQTVQTWAVLCLYYKFWREKKRTSNDDWIEFGLVKKVFVVVLRF